MSFQREDEVRQSTSWREKEREIWGNSATLREREQAIILWLLTPTLIRKIGVEVGKKT